MGNVTATPELSIVADLDEHRVRIKAWRGVKTGIEERSSEKLAPCPFPADMAIVCRRSYTRLVSGVADGEVHVEAL